MSHHSSEIQIRDPFVALDQGRYWLFGSTDPNIWTGPGRGFDCYTLDRPLHLGGAGRGVRRTPRLRGAPRTLRGAGGAPARRALVPVRHLQGAGTPACVARPRADTAQGPYEPWSAGLITPEGWQCLDATLFVADDGTPWTVFCREWQQVHDGGMWAMPLTPDLRRAAGRNPRCGCSTRPRRPGRGRWCCRYYQGTSVRLLRHRRPVPASDGLGTLLLLWSSFTDAGYAMGVARSASGLVTGPWVHDPEPLIDGGCGHGMVFRGLDGELRATYHTPNSTPGERLVIRTLIEDGDRLRLAD